MLRSLYVMFSLCFDFDICFFPWGLRHAVNYGRTFVIVATAELWGLERGGCNKSEMALMGPQAKYAHNICAKTILCMYVCAWSIYINYNELCSRLNHN